MKVLSDILDAADCRQVTLLGLLDLSAAFDTVDQRLGTSFGLGGPVLEWLKSFLSSRQQAVMFRGQTSARVACVRSTARVCPRTLAVSPVHGRCRDHRQTTRGLI